MGILSKLVAAVVEHNRIRAREIEGRLYPDKRRIYKDVLERYLKLLQSVARSSKPPERAISRRDIEELHALKRELVMFAGAEVIAAWNEMERESVDSNPGDSTAQTKLLSLDRVIRRMREDLGYDDSELPPGALFGLFLKPEEKHLLIPES